jgi:hypothetical protein
VVMAASSAWGVCIQALVTVSKAFQQLPGLIAFSHQR